MQLIDIQKLDFGMDSAEIDQVFLEKVFIYTSVFDRVKDGKKHLVLGRKGAGKTAVCLKLYNYLDKQGAKVSLIVPRDLQQFKIRMLEKGSLNSAESSLLAWKYVFLIQLCKHLLEEAKKVYGKNYISWPEHIQEMRKFVVFNEEEKTSWLERTFKIISRVKTIGVKPPAGPEITMELQGQEAQGHVFDHKLDNITEAVHVSLKTLALSPVYLLVDKVDEIWDSAPESKQLIIGLLRAMKEILEELEIVHVVVFLRSDIYRDLEFHDSDKFHTVEEQVYWTKPDLKEMIVLRAKLSTGLLNKKQAQKTIQEQQKHQEKNTIDSAWQIFFQPGVDGKDSFEFILDYTFMRPRDLIQLCNICRDKAQNNWHKKIEAEDIIAALPKYSEWKLQDLRDEYSIQYPFLEILFLTVFYGTKSRLSREDIQKALDRVKEGLIGEFGSYYFQPINRLLQILYDIGFLGALNKNTVRYSFLGDKVIIAYVSEFEMHPVFRWALANSPDLASSKAMKDTLEKLEEQVSYNIPAWLDSTLTGNIRGVEQTSSVFSKSEGQKLVRLQVALMETFSREDIYNLIRSLKLQQQLEGRGSQERIVTELVIYCARNNMIAPLLIQVVAIHPEVANRVLFMYE